LLALPSAWLEHGRLPRRNHHCLWYGGVVLRDPLTSGFLAGAALVLIGLSLVSR
jgi:hypothetical protein